MKSLHSFRSLAGQLLIASPLIRDGIFYRSVIFLTEHSEEDGAQGFIINSFSGRKVMHAVAAGELPELSHVPTFHGGPVKEDKLLFGSITVESSEFASFTPARTNQEAITMMDHPQCQLFAYIGYSSWIAGQLEDELTANTWYVSPPRKSLLSHKLDRSLWRNLLRELSPYHAIVAECPEELLAN